MPPHQTGPLWSRVPSSVPVLLVLVTRPLRCVPPAFLLLLSISGWAPAPLFGLSAFLVSALHSDLEHNPSILNTYGGFYFPGWVLTDRNWAVGKMDF